MSTREVRLTRPVRVGAQTFDVAVLREATVEDLLEATDEAERPHLTEDGYVLLASNTRLGFCLIRRQVARLEAKPDPDQPAVATHPGPLAEEEAKLLHPRDLRRLQAEALVLETALAAEELAKRGRDPGTPG